MPDARCELESLLAELSLDDGLIAVADTNAVVLAVALMDSGGNAGQ